MKKGQAFTDFILERDQEKISNQDDQTIGLDFIETVKQMGYPLKKAEDLVSTYLQPLFDSVLNFTGITPINSFKTVDNQEFYRALKEETINLIPPHLREYCVRLSDAYWNADKEEFLKLSDEDPIKFLTLFDSVKHITGMASYSAGAFSQHGNCIFIDVEKSERFNYYAFFNVFNKTEKIKQAHEEALSFQRGEYKYLLTEELAHSTHNGILKQNKERFGEFMELYEQFIQSLVTYPEDALNGFLPAAFSIEGTNIRFIPLKDLSKCEKLYIIITNLGLGAHRDFLKKLMLKKLPSELNKSFKRLARCYNMSSIPPCVGEGYSEVVVNGILSSDGDYQKFNVYAKEHLKKGDILPTLISYRMLGQNFVNRIYETLGKKTFMVVNQELPTIRELNNPSDYLTRIK